MSVSIVPPLTLAKLLSPETIELSLRASERGAVFTELIEKIPDLAHKPDAKRALLHALEERERLGSTSLGHGIALPHTRNAISRNSGPAIIVFGRHHRGIAYGANDGAPVQLLFLLVAPSINLHLQILARLSRILRDAALRQSLLEAEQPEDVIELIREAEKRMAA